MIDFKPISQRPFLSVTWIIAFIYLYLETLLSAPEFSESLNRTILFGPYLMAVGFLPYKPHKIFLLTAIQLLLYIGINYELPSNVLYQELFIFFLLISIFILNHYHGHKTLKTWTALQFEKKQTYKNLVKMEHLYREVYDGGGIARALIKENGEIIDINPKWNQTFHDALNIGANCRPIIPYFFETKKDFKNLKDLKNFFLKKDAIKIPYTFLKGNKNLIFQLHIWYSHPLSMYFVNLLDSTESILKEKEVSQKEKLVHLGLSAAGCAHDIFNPLSSIILNLDLISENNGRLKEKYGPKKEIEENSELVSKSLEGSNVIKTLIGRLKSFTKNLESTKDRNNLLEIIKFANEIFHLPLKEKINIELKGDLKSPYFIHDHANNFFQVFLNLFNNSYNSFKKKASADKKIVITITEKKDSRVQVKVLDFANGIPRDEIKNIFDLPFQTKDQNYSGIGLFITKKMVEKIGGTIGLISEEGKFTELTLNLPFYQEEKAKVSLNKSLT